MQMNAAFNLKYFPLSVILDFCRKMRDYVHCDDRYKNMPSVTEKVPVRHRGNENIF